MNPSATLPHSQAALSVFAGDSEMAALMRSRDWSKTSLGPVESWSPTLKTMVRTLLANRFQMLLWWGPEYIQLYNDAYRPIPGAKHPGSMGQSASECWGEIWHILRPLVDTPFRGGPSTWMEDILLEINRHGFLEETHYTIAYSPVPDETVSGGIGGVLATVHEITEKVIGERRMAALRDLGTAPAEAKTAEEACTLAAKSLAAYDKDVPFALLYLMESDGERARLAAATGDSVGAAIGPVQVDLELADESVWPFADAKRSGLPQVVSGLGSRVSCVPRGPWSDPPHTALVLPIRSTTAHELAGFLVAGTSARLRLDDAYRGFLELATAQIGTAITNARALEAERRRADALAELDQAKSVFFSNVSHEFRTPLTLMLGPVEDLLAKPQEDLPNAARQQLEVVNRNGLRLLRLVNTLLDFSRIQAGRVRGAYQPIDLAALTADLASLFRSACERVGLQLEVDCAQLTAPVFVDPDMWEKVVLNLLSNALKFTFEGAIRVTLRQAGDCAELCVRDTGAGIPAAEMPRLFERFHRGESTRGRTHEGSGIGLALVQELVALHGGTVRAESELGQGTTFRVSLPLGSAHLPPDQITQSRAASAPRSGLNPYVEEALRWLPEEEGEAASVHEATPAALGRGQERAHDDRPRVLVADDNADMRQYVVRLLAERYRIEAVADGEAAYAAARERRPDLILTDVMMPRLDGLGLLRKLRADPRTSSVPVIMLSARAGEESRIEGLDAGADDYLMKPFSAKELVARVSAHLQLSQLRRAAGQALRQSEERLRMALAAARMVAWEWTPADRHFHVSDNAAAVFGLQPATALTDIESWLALVHPADAAAYQATFEEAIATQSDYLTHYRVIRPDDSRLLWMEERGQATAQAAGAPVRLFGVVMDVTERIRVEEEMREARSRLDSTLVAGEIGTWEYDVVRDQLCADSRLARMFGVSTEDAAGGPLAAYLQAIHPEDRARVREALDPSQRASDDAQVEFRLVLPGEALRWAVARGRVERDESGRAVRQPGVIVDITARKQLEHELRELAASLRDADRRKDEFLAMLAHELRNPLAPLRNGLQVMGLARGNPVATEQARTMMERQLGNLVRLVDDLLDVNRISQGKLELRKEAVDLALVLANAVETSRSVIEASAHQLELRLPAEPILVDADITRLAQVFANLLNNAAKYSERGGRIGLSAVREDGEVLVRVSDTGVGIPADMLTKIFDMFTQVDRSLEKAQGGLGIGLMLVKKLVEMHAGSVEALSEGQGKGSTFVVRLPVLSSARPKPAPPAPTAGTSTGVRILVADDNQDSARSLAMILKLRGHELRIAYDGSEALEVAEAFRPDVLLLDIGMPALNGYEVCRRIRKQAWSERAVIIAVTGWGQDEDRRRSQEAGFTHHMTKPVAIAEVEQILSAAASNGKRSG